MGGYLIEFRFIHYPTKKKIKRLIWHVDKKFHLRRAKYARPVPHISLAGPLTTNNETRLIKDFHAVCSRHPLMKFKVKGFNVFKDNRVVYLDIKPSTRLEDYRWDLAEKIKPYCQLRPHDRKKEFYFHSTIAMKLSPHKYDMIKKYVQNMHQVSFDYIMVRATIIKGGRILVEYDFLQRKLLNRHQAKSRRGSTITGKLLDAYFKGKHDPNKNVSKKKTVKRITKPKVVQPVQEVIKTADISPGFLGRLFKRKIFVISDNHFDHANIIKHCKRPFRNSAEMNQHMLEKWNKTVGRNDSVLYLGDMSNGKRSNGKKCRPADYWLSKLNGRVIFIKGYTIKENGARVQHDTISRQKDVYDKLIVKYNNEELLLVHDPAEVPKSWNGWAICGHHHNNRPVEFPLVNKKLKRFNVSVELLDYTPIELDELLSKRSDK